MLTVFEASFAMAAPFRYVQVRYQLETFPAAFPSLLLVYVCLLP